MFIVDNFQKIIQDRLDNKIIEYSLVSKKFETLDIHKVNSEDRNNVKDLFQLSAEIDELQNVLYLLEKSKR